MVVATTIQMAIEQFLAQRFITILIITLQMVSSLSDDKSVPSDNSVFKCGLARSQFFLLL